MLRLINYECGKEMVPGGWNLFLFLPGSLGKSKFAASLSNDFLRRTGIDELETVAESSSVPNHGKGVNFS
jgi:hypothetical protein